MRRSGFILKDYLLSLLIIMSLFPIIVTCFDVVSSVKLFDSELHDLISINQLRDRLVYASDFRINGNDLDFIFKDKEMSLRYANHRLYMFPGYLLYLNELDDLEFYFENNTILISYYKEGQYYNYALCKS